MVDKAVQVDMKAEKKQRDVSVDSVEVQSETKPRNTDQLSSRENCRPATIGNVAPIRKRYRAVWLYMDTNRVVSLERALSILKIGKTTLRGTLPIAELKLVDKQVYQGRNR